MANDVLVQRIESKILLIRGQKVLLDADLAGLYDVETGQLNRAVRRNLQRFPADFMFQLTKAEVEVLRCQIGILKQGQHFKYLPFAFTENGVAMLSSVLNSERAIAVNIRIMRTFTKLRMLLASHVDLARKLEALERKYDGQFKIVFEAIRKILEPAQKTAPKIGFTPR